MPHSCVSYEHMHKPTRRTYSCCHGNEFTGRRSQSCELTQLLRTQRQDFHTRAWAVYGAPPNEFRVIRDRLTNDCVHPTRQNVQRLRVYKQTMPRVRSWQTVAVVRGQYAYP